ncbi:MAG: hypothetical protein NT154_39005, partial [Verrucomicrobia bacterium]|nr:hypothetical protein [Verrucomicrobiota bacterium]
SELNVDFSPTEIKEVAVRFQKENARLGGLSVSGPFDMQKLEGRLNIVLAGIDKQLLNLAGAKRGMDFGGTTISSTNVVELAKGGSVITAKGQFDLRNFELTRLSQTTPKLDVRKEYDVTIDRGQNLVTLRTLAVTGTQDGKTFLKAELTKPMQIPLGSTNVALVDSALTVAITNFDLADWKPFLGSVAPEGLLNMTAKVQSQQSDQRVSLAVDSRLERLTVIAGTNQIADVAITVHVSANSTGMKQFNLTDYKLEVAHKNETLTTVSASGTYDMVSEATDMQVAVQAALAPLLRMVPQPSMTLSSGAVQMKAHITQKQKEQAVTGNFTLADFSGRFGTNEVRGLGTTADFDLGMTPKQVQIRKVAGKLTQGGNAAGSLDLSGTFDPVTQDADLQANAQMALAPLMQAAPQPSMSVSSGTVELKTHVTQKQKAPTVTGSLVLADFSGRFGTNEVRSLGTVVDFDVGMTPQQAQIRKFAGKLTQGANVGGSFEMTATYDLVKTNASLTAKLVDFNQNGLGQFLEPALGGKKLASVAINGNASVQFDPIGASSVNSDLQMTNLVVKDPTVQFPATPLEAKMHVDVSLQKQVANVRQLSVTLTPTSRATNQVQLSG